MNSAQRLEFEQTSVTCTSRQQPDRTLVGIAVPHGHDGLPAGEMDAAKRQVVVVDADRIKARRSSAP